MRNKPIALSSLASLSRATAGAGADSGGGAAKSKVPSLRWNEERLELEVVRREREASEALSRSRHLLASQEASQEAVMAPANAAAGDGHYLLRRQTSGHSLEVGSVIFPNKRLYVFLFDKLYYYKSKIRSAHLMCI
jgi:hypothetical protein